MNALRPVIQRNAARRFASTTAAPAPKFVPSQYQYSVKTSWFSDPSTYPIIFVMSGAMVLMGGAIVHALKDYKDVQINPAKRSQLLQHWGEERKEPLVKKGINTNLYRKMTKLD